MATVGSVWALKTGRDTPDNYADTQAGVQDALDACETAGGGTVFIRGDAGISISTASIKVPKYVRLVGTPEGGSQATFIAAATASLTAMMENKYQDGTQDYCAIEGISLDGNKAAGALISTALLYMKRVRSGSRIRNVRAINGSGDGIQLDGTSGAAGSFLLENPQSTGHTGYAIHFKNQCENITTIHPRVEFSGTGSSGTALIYVENPVGSSASGGHIFQNVNAKSSDTTAPAVVFSNVSNCTVDGLWTHGSGVYCGVQIIGTGSGSDGSFGSSGHVLKNLLVNNALIIDDQVAGIQVTNTNGRFIQWYTSPVEITNIYKSQIIGMQSSKIGLSVASIATVTLGNGSLFIITGTTTITSVTATGQDAGRIVVLKFADILTLTDGSNLKLNGNFTTSSDATITMVCDGAYWIELARSTN